MSLGFGRQPFAPSCRSEGVGGSEAPVSPLWNPSEDRYRAVFRENDTARVNSPPRAVSPEPVFPPLGKIQGTPRFRLEPISRHFHNGIVSVSSSDVREGDERDCV